MSSTIESKEVVKTDNKDNKNNDRKSDIMTQLLKLPRWKLFKLTYRRSGGYLTGGRIPLLSDELSKQTDLIEASNIIKDLNNKSPDAISRAYDSIGEFFIDRFEHFSKMYSLGKIDKIDENNNSKLLYQGLLATCCIHDVDGNSYGSGFLFRLKFTPTNLITSSTDISNVSTTSTTSATSNISNVDTLTTSNFITSDISSFSNFSTTSNISTVDVKDEKELNDIILIITCDHVIYPNEEVKDKEFIARFICPRGHDSIIRLNINKTNVFRNKLDDWCAIKVSSDDVTTLNDRGIYPIVASSLSSLSPSLSSSLSNKSLLFMPQFPTFKELFNEIPELLSSHSHYNLYRRLCSMGHYASESIDSVDFVKEGKFIHNTLTTRCSSGSPIFNTAGEIIGMQLCGLGECVANTFYCNNKAIFIKNIVDYIISFI